MRSKKVEKVIYRRYMVSNDGDNFRWNESRGIVFDLAQVKIFDIENPMNWVSSYSLF